MKTSGRTLGFPHAEIGGLERQQAGVDGGIFGQRPLKTADAAGHAEHLIAGPEARHVRPHRLDRAGKVDAENGGQRMLRVGRVASVDFRIERVHSAGGYADQDLIVARHRAGDCR